jgi:hypothetical protein
VFEGCRSRGVLRFGATVEPGPDRRRASDDGSSTSSVDAYRSDDLSRRGWRSTADLGDAIDMLLSAVGRGGRGRSEPARDAVVRQSARTTASSSDGEAEDEGMNEGRVKSGDELMLSLDEILGNLPDEKAEEAFSRDLATICLKVLGCVAFRG